eukprot:scaffold18758_cov31-Tisochrysis_lutea.AAC.1
MASAHGQMWSLLVGTKAYSRSATSSSAVPAQVLCNDERAAARVRCVMDWLPRRYLLFVLC